MALTTYAELQTAVSDFLNRDDLASAVPDFITLGEARMQRDLRHWQMEKRATASATGQYLALPADFLQPIRLHVSGQHQPLEALSYYKMQDLRDKADDVTGVPKYYSMTAGQIELYPSPDDTYTIEFYYIRTLPALSVSNTSNWLLSEAPDIYLYGSLIQSAPYLVQDERIVTWASLYQSAVDSLNDQSNRAKWGGGKMVIR